MNTLLGSSKTRDSHINYVVTERRPCEATAAPFNYIQKGNKKFSLVEYSALDIYLKNHGFPGDRS